VPGEKVAVNPPAIKPNRELTLAEGRVLAPRAERCPPAEGNSIAVDPAIVRLLSNRAVVIGLLAISGPIGLPALWLSRRFSRTTKIVTTVAFLLATVAFPLALTYYWTEIALRPLVEAFDSSKP
jgi:hypothetical protein